MFGDPTLAIEDGDDPKAKSADMPGFYTLLERIFDLSPALAKLLTVIMERFLGYI
jgi:hypothetical protein